MAASVSLRSTPLFIRIGPLGSAAVRSASPHRSEGASEASAPAEAERGPWGPRERRRGGVRGALAPRKILERETGIEPATNSLEGCDSTIELLPPTYAARFLTPTRRLRRASPPRGSLPSADTPAPAGKPTTRLASFRRLAGSGGQAHYAARLLTPTRQLRRASPPRGSLPSADSPAPAGKPPRGSLPSADSPAPAGKPTTRLASFRRLAGSGGQAHHAARFLTPTRRLRRASPPRGSLPSADSPAPAGKPTTRLASFRRHAGSGGQAQTAARFLPPTRRLRRASPNRGSLPYADSPAPAGKPKPRRLLAHHPSVTHCSTTGSAATPHSSRLRTRLPAGANRCVLRGLASPARSSVLRWLVSRSLAAKRRAKADGEGRIRTFEGAGPTDLQSAAFDRFATSPELPVSQRPRHAPPLSTRPMTCQDLPFCEFLFVDV